MIAQVIKSLSTRQYQVKDLTSSKILKVSGTTEWRPGDKVVVVDGFIVGRGPDKVTPEVFRV